MSVAAGLSPLVLLGATAAAFYTLGAGTIEGQVNYRTWRLIGADTFRGYHRALGPRVVALLFAPFGCGVLLTLALLGWRPPGIPTSVLVLAVGLDAFAIAVTLLWQLPAQRRLDRDGWSAPVVDQLIRREWSRLIPHLIKALLLTWLLARLLGASVEVAS